MVYSNHFVVCVLVDNKPQKERKDGIVLVPYGSEYSLRFRNKHNRRAVVKFTIDDEDVAGPGYIIPAHSAVDIHRHHNKDRRFKFVSLDSGEAVDFGKTDNHDGSKGVIVAKFFLEQPAPAPIPWPVEHHHHHHHHYPQPPRVWPCTNNPWKPNDVWLGAQNVGSCQRRNMSGGTTYGSTYSSSSGGSASCSASNSLGIPDQIKCSMESVSLSGSNQASMKFGDGCTVEGGSSGQTFGSQWINLESDFVELRLVLKGVDAPVAQAAASEEYCTACGAKRLRKSDRFCGSCGHRF